MRGAAPSPTSEPAAAENLGTVIGFAAEPGRPALDGAAGENSPYAAALLRHLGAMDGIEFGQVMRMVTEEVYLDTKTKQRPWVNESLRRLLYFGVPQPEPTGEDGLITGERRQLLLTISELPDFNRAQVETVAAKDGVPLDALYGVLRALGTEKIPEDPTELEKLLDAQAGGLKDDDRPARRAEDRRPRDQAAHRRRRPGDPRRRDRHCQAVPRQAVKRVEATRAQVDAAEEAVKQQAHCRRCDLCAARRRRVAGLRLSRGGGRLRQGRSSWSSAGTTSCDWNYKNWRGRVAHERTAKRQATATVLEAARSTHTDVILVLHPRRETGP